MHPPSRVHPPPVYGPASAPLDEPLSTPEERDAFRALGIPWIPPTDREDWRLRVGA
jgi:DNA polymerase/3'-5' exonuclease PolX